MRSTVCHTDCSLILLDADWESIRMMLYAFFALQREIKREIKDPPKPRTRAYIRSLPIHPFAWIRLGK